MNSSKKSFQEKVAEYFPKAVTSDYLGNAEKLGIPADDKSLTLNFFNHQVIFSPDGIHAIEGPPLTAAVKTVVCQYLLRCPDPAPVPSNRLVSIRELAGSGPLYSNFTTNTGKIIETTFSGGLDNLATRCRELGGIPQQNSAYDLSMTFTALSRIPMFLNFNDTDEMMTASAVFLFFDNAARYLDLEGLTVLCTYLTGRLIQQPTDTYHQ